MTARVVLLVTTPTVPAGLLTWRAWRELHEAAQVLAASAGHPLLPALTEAGIGWQALAAGPGPATDAGSPAAGEGAGDLAGAGGQADAGGQAGAGGEGAAGTAALSTAALSTEGTAAVSAAVAARLAAAATGTGGTVVWLCGPGGPAAAGAAAEAGAGQGEAGALAAALAELPGGVSAEIVTGAWDLPGGQLVRLAAIMDRLRVECPWDARQTHESLAPHLLEEPYEALEALESGDPAALREELGDVLLQVMFHARIAAERSDGTGYTIDDVAEGIAAKLVRRHPHVFGDVFVSGHEDVKRNWDAIKAAEREAAGGGPASALDGVPFGQPALALAAQLQRRAERAGAPPELAALAGRGAGAGDGAPAGSASVSAEAGNGAEAGHAGGQPGAGLGAELFALVARAQTAGLDPELELRAAARRYRERVRAWEQARRG